LRGENLQRFGIGVMTIISILSIICITLFGLFGVFAIFTNQGNRRANKLLGFFFLLWAFDFLDGLLLLNGFYLEHPDFALWGEPLVFLYGPLLYFYTLHIVRKKKVFTLKVVLHLLPFLMYLIIIVVNFHMLPKVAKINILNAIIELKQPFEIFLFLIVIYAHFFSYIFLSKIRIRKTVNNLNNFYSHHNLSWLNVLLNAFLIILSISVFTSVLQFYHSREYFKIGLPILIIVMGLFVVGVILNALNRPFIFLDDNDAIKYVGYKLDLDETDIISKKITNALESEKLYLNPELNLKDFSKAIDINSRKVSQVINDTFHKSFFDLINSYRIEAATERLKNNKDPKLTVLEVMYEVGFNSKSSFNTQFKNRTGLTPSEFKRLN